jgi:anti-anti-sigma regulatory factor
VEYYKQRKTSDSFTRALWQSWQQSHLVGNQEEVAREIMNLTLRNIFEGLFNKL